MRISEQEVVASIDEVTVRRLRRWVRQGWIVPSKASEGHRFDELDLARVRLVCQLQDELDLKEDTVPVVLSLIDQVYGLRRELKALTVAIEAQPKETREAIKEAYLSAIGSPAQ